jgi:LmbE family N-acetylglucosaminyl deacetylase
VNPLAERPLGTVDLEHTGTPAQVWRRWLPLLPELATDAWRRVVVVAAHPDDEVLGVGGLMARLVADGVDVTVVAVTDGDAARPPVGWSPQRLARTRVAEARRGCARLGVRPAERLGIPDGAVAASEAAVEDAVAERLTEADVCLATWAGDGHPDHEAVGRAAARACGRTAARLLEYPVWMWHWARPDGPGVPWPRAAAVSLTAAQLRLKAQAVGCHRTQLEPPGDGDAAVLPPFVVDRLINSREVLFR